MNGKDQRNEKNGFQISGSRLIRYSGGERHVVIPSGMTEIGEQAFRGCKNLRRVTVGTGVKRIAPSAFYCCDTLREISIAESVTEIGRSAFYGCAALRRVELNARITSVAESLFQGCVALTEITVPEGVREICSCAFENCRSLVHASLPRTLTAVKEEAFGGCASLAGMEIPEGVTEIDRFAFSDCERLLWVSLPATLTRIAKCAFQRCAALQEISIPAGVTELELNTFEDCTALRTVTLLGTPARICTSAFEGCEALALRAERGARYLGTAENPYFALISAESTEVVSVFIHPSCRLIAAGAFEGCKRLTHMEFPEGIEAIEDRTFFGCTALKTMAFPRSLTHFSFDAIGLGHQIEHFEAPLAREVADLFYLYQIPKRIVILTAEALETFRRYDFHRSAMLASLFRGFAYAYEKGYEIPETGKRAYLDCILENWELALKEESFCRFLVDEELLSLEETDRAIELTASVELRAMLIEYKRNKFGGGDAGTLFLPED